MNPDGNSVEPAEVIHSGEGKGERLERGATLPPFDFPGVVVIDTREQAPFNFGSLRCDSDRDYRPLRVPTVVGTLKQGDYSLLGYEGQIALERKSAADLFGTIGQERDRFERELERLNHLRFAAVVVEADWSELLHEPPSHSSLPPKVVFRSVLAWQQRFRGVHWAMMPSRRLAEVYTFRALERFWKDRQKELKELKAATRGGVEVSRGPQA